jgi:hypothetical protein
MFELFNIYHYIYLLIIIFSFIFLNKWFRNKEDKKEILFILSVINFIIHFVKVFLYPYNEVTTQFYFMSLSNLCAVNVVLYPFIIKINNKWLNYYFQFICFISGIVAIIYPYELVNFNAFNIESIRYFVTHFILLFISFELFKINKFNYKSIFISYFIFIFEQCVILLNDFVFYKIKVIPNIDYSNGSLIYGINPKLDSIKYIIDNIVPNIFKNEDMYIYLIWQIVPLIYIFIVFFIVSILFIDNRHFKNDWYSLKYMIIKIFNKKYFNKNDL